MIPQIRWQSAGKWEIAPTTYLIPGRIKQGGVELRLTDFILKVSFPNRHTKANLSNSNKRLFRTDDVFVQIVESGSARITESELELIPKLVRIAKERLIKHYNE